MIVTESMDKPVTVESGKHSTEGPIETCHNSVPNPSRDIIASPEQSELGNNYRPGVDVQLSDPLVLLNNLV